MLLPWNDWQFWMVTAAMFGSAWMVVRQFLPRRDNAPACGSCAAGAAACAKKTPAGVRREPSLVVLESRRG